MLLSIERPGEVLFAGSHPQDDREHGRTGHPVSPALSAVAKALAVASPRRRQAITRAATIRAVIRTMVATSSRGRSAAASAMRNRRRTGAQRKAVSRRISIEHDPEKSPPSDLIRGGAGFPSAEPGRSPQTQLDAGGSFNFFTGPPHTAAVVSSPRARFFRDRFLVRFV